MTDFSEYRDSDSLIVTEALKYRCGMCGAPKGKPCTDLLSGKPLYEALERYVHFYRAEP